MHQIFSTTVFSKDDVPCPKCTWKGKGSEVKQEQLLLTDAIELYCPTCDGYIGFVSLPDQQE